MDSSKVLVVGHSANLNPKKTRSNSPTINRINKWLGECDVYTYSFVNLFSPGSTSGKNAQINETFLPEYLSNYNKIITLGNDVSQYFKKLGVSHFSAPHPSPRNRKFNNKSFEPDVIKRLQIYLNMI
jgi:hypothetical protein|tara:strand:- start:913 stop:1293 length:381 start_codon:yes stop_codon:yes gene_type:complete